MMSFSSKSFRFFWTHLSKAKINYRTITRIVSNTTPKSDKTLPCALGFSLYTLLGFDKKLSAEDELILTIKHCIILIQRTEYQRAEQLLHIALRQAQQVQHKLGITYVYDVMANLALEREQLDKAKTLFINVSQRLMTDGATEDDLRIIHISLKLARISHLKKEYQTAQMGFDWCLKKLNDAITNKPEDPVLLWHLTIAKDWYGRLFLDCNQYDHGLKLMLDALNLMKQQSDIKTQDIVFQMSDIGAVCAELNQVDESINYLKEAIELGKTLDSYEGLGAVYVNLGRAFIKKKLYDNARKSCGFGWKLGFKSKDEDSKKQAELCLEEIKKLAS